MKIKINKLKITENKSTIELNNIEFEISINEIREMNEFENKSNVEYKIPDLIDKKLYYKNYHQREFDNLVEIKFLDKIEIMSSEFCLTNNDKIKYDEILSDEYGTIQSININDKTCLIKFENEMIQSCVVPITWLKFISRNNRKK